MFVTAAHAESTPAAGATHSETGTAHDAGSGVFPPFDQSTYASQLLWLAITFGLFYLLMQKVIVPRVGGILENRHDRIAQDLDEASRLKADADAAVEAYEKELAAARASAGSIAAAARDAAKEKADAERAAIEAELSTKITEAEARIAALRESAFAEVGAIASETAGAIIDQLVNEKVSDAELKAAVAAVSEAKGA